MSTHDADVVIVGAGFAGLVAARELSARGLDVVVLEGRDRMGGRTWVDERLGTKLEMGGTWVHWLEPHVWAEINRYGQRVKLTGNNIFRDASWVVDGTSRTVGADEAASWLDAALQEFFADSRVHFPTPYADPASYELDAETDAVSAGEALDRLGLGEDAYVFADAILSGTLSAPMHEASLTQALRWTAAAGHNWANMFEASSGYKLENGTAGLIDAIAADVQGEIRLSTAVEAVERGSTGFTVTCRSGERITAGAVVVTAPRNALQGIEFRPALSAGKREVLAQGPAGMGTKVWMRVRGDLTGWCGYAGWQNPLSVACFYDRIDDDSVLVGFGPSAERLDVTDLDQVSAAVARWRSDIEVLACEGHDWVRDEFSRETWLVQRPGQHRYLAELQRPEDGLFLVGSDYASGWTGYIDGAVESAVATAPKILDHLRA